MNIDSINSFSVLDRQLNTIEVSRTWILKITPFNFCFNNWYYFKRKQK